MPNALTLSGVVFGIIAGIGHMPWSSIFLLPSAAFILIENSSTKKGAKAFVAYRFSRINLFLLLFIVYYVVFLDFSETLYRDIYVVHPLERQALEFISLILNLLVFSSACSAKTPISARSLHFAVTYLSTEGLQYTFGVNHNENPQIYAYGLYLFIPLISIYFLQRNTRLTIKTLIICSLTTSIVLMFVFSTRVPALGVLVFLISYIIFPTIRKSRLAYYAIIISYIIALISSVFLYIYLADAGVISSFTDSSEETFGKGVDGRMYIWPDLVDSIFDNIWFGHCSNCSSEYFQNSTNSRNLSSHNTYLELLFRGGVVWLSLFFIVVVLVLKKIRHLPNNTQARFGFAYIFSILLFMNSNEFGITQTFTSNIVFWWLIGLFYRNFNIKDVDNQRELIDRKNI